MTWDVEFDDAEAVQLRHDDGYVIYASRAIRADSDDWNVMVNKGTRNVETRSHSVADEEQLWEILDEYTERYPPE